MSLILNDFVLALAISNQSRRKPHTRLGIKQGELPCFAISVVISQPHYSRFSFSLLRHTFDMIVMVWPDIIGNIEFIRSSTRSLQDLHGIDDSARLRVD